MGDATDFDRDDRPSTAQPPPVPNDYAPMHDRVAVLLRTLDCHALAEHMTARGEFGRRKYGTPLQPHNGRNAVADALEETLDAAVYIAQQAVERFDVEAAETPMWKSLLHRQLSIAEDLRAWLEDDPHSRGVPVPS